MAVISGFRTKSPGRLPCPSISSDLSGFGTDIWAWGTSAVSRRATGVLVTAWPVSAAPLEIAGYKVTSYFTDFYNRIHVIPRRLDLGNVASTQVSSVTVWNAFLQPQLLTDIESLGTEGISLSGQDAPATIAGLRELTYIVSVTPDGPPVVDASITWRFLDVADSSLAITATRIVAFAFLPDWRDGVRERLSWLTRVLAAPTAHEQRAALRLSPRRQLSAPVVVAKNERQQFDLLLWGWGARTFALPIWHQIQFLSAPLAAGSQAITCATTKREFRDGGLAILRGATVRDVEIVEVLTVGPTGLVLKRPTQRQWVKGTRLYPAVPARLEQQPQLTRITDQHDGGDVSFGVSEASDFTAAGPSTLYRGIPVLESRPDETRDLTHSFLRLLRELDNGSALPHRTDLAKQALPIRAHSWTFGGRDAHESFRQFLYFLQGRFAALWIPSFADDLTLTQPITASGTSMTVAWVGYTRYAGGKAGRRDIRIELRNGTVFHRRINSSTEGATEETLLLDSALGTAVAVSAVGRISWLMLCRSNQDDIELQHVHDADGVTACDIVFRGVLDEL